MLYQAFAPFSSDMAADVPQLFLYLDDGISGQRDYVSAGAASLIQRSDLASSGFIPKESK